MLRVLRQNSFDSVQVVPYALSMEKAERMRTKSHSSNIVTLKNGSRIKGVYSLSLTGMHVTIYLVNVDGVVLANRNYAFTCAAEEGRDKMLTLIGALNQLCVASKFDLLQHFQAQEAAARGLLRVMTREAIFKTAAA